MITAEIKRVLGSSVLSGLGKWVGPRLLIIVALAFFGLWGYTKFVKARLDTVETENVALMSDKARIAALNKQLGVALEQVKTYELERSRRETQANQAIRGTNETIDSTLDLPIPLSVLRILREPIGFTDATNPTRAELGAGSPDSL